MAFNSLPQTTFPVALLRLFLLIQIVRLLCWFQEMHSKIYIHINGPQCSCFVIQSFNSKLAGLDRLTFAVQNIQNVQHIRQLHLYFFYMLTQFYIIIPTQTSTKSIAYIRLSKLRMSKQRKLLLGSSSIVFGS